MTEPYYQDEQVTVYAGDCLDVLKTLPDNSIDAVVTDPPYGLEFMGKEWDGADGFRRSLNPADVERDNIVGRTSRTSPQYRVSSEFQTWCGLWATECLRVLKPGAHLAAFGGTRTWHRLAVAVEDAGFEIRDNLAWLYGSGFPKSLDVSKAIDKAAGAEREVVDRRIKTNNTVSSRQHLGAIDGRAADGRDMAKALAYQARGGFDITAPATDAAKQWQGWGTALKPAWESIVLARKPIRGTVAANVCEHGTGALNIDACRVGTGGQLKWSSPRDMGYHGGSDSAGTATENPAGRWPANVLLDADAAAELDKQSGVLHAPMSNGRRKNGAMFDVGAATQESTYQDYGSASRYFPIFKYTPKAPGDERPTVDGTSHPTVKPVELMRWLIKLVTPPHGLVLDPFAGTGTTAEACIKEHMRATIIERESDYLPLIVARLTKPMAVGFDFEEGA